MNADTKHYTCRTCGSIVEYIVPCNIEYIDDYPFKIITPIHQSYYKSVARYNHNMTHKGALDMLENVEK